MKLNFLAIGDRFAKCLQFAKQQTLNCYNIGSIEFEI